MQQNKEELAHILRTLPQQSKKQACVGFDAAIDSLVQAAQTVYPDGRRDYFSTINRFGGYLSSKSGLSCVVELDTIVEKPGGNMVNLSNALGMLGVPVDCVGTLGQPEIHPLFRKISPNCKLHSVGEPGTCTALEFSDGKVMLAHMEKPNRLTFEQMKQLLGIARLRELFCTADLIALVNWSELRGSTGIWRGILQELITMEPPDKSRLVLIDITDCSRHSEEQILELVQIIEGFTTYRKTVVSLNENEACRLAQVLGCGVGKATCTVQAQALAQKLRVDVVVVHPLKGSVAVEGGKLFSSRGFFVPAPVISTGGGDNYNAGLSWGLLHSLPIGQCMLLANAVSSCYVRCGYSPDCEQVAQFLEDTVPAKKGGDFK